MPQLKQLMFKWLLGWWLIILCLRYYIATFQDIWHRLIPGDSIPRTRWSTMCMGCFNFHNLLSRCSYRINYGMKNMARRTIFLGTLPMMTSWYGNSFHLRGEFTQSPVDFLTKGQSFADLMLPLLLAWTNRGTNSQVVIYLRRHASSVTPWGLTVWIRTCVTSNPCA